MTVRKSRNRPIESAATDHKHHEAVVIIQFGATKKKGIQFLRACFALRPVLCSIVLTSLLHHYWIAYVVQLVSEYSVKFVFVFVPSIARVGLLRFLQP